MKIEASYSTLNISTNPLPNHGDRANRKVVNVIRGEGDDTICEVEQLIDHFDKILQIRVEGSILI